MKSFALGLVAGVAVAALGHAVFCASSAPGPGSLATRDGSRLDDQIAQLREGIRELATARANGTESVTLDHAAVPSGADRVSITHSVVDYEPCMEEVRRMFSLLFWCMHDDDFEIAAALEGTGRSPFEPGLSEIVEKTVRRLQDVRRRAQLEMKSLREQLGVDATAGDENRRRKLREDFDRAWQPQKEAFDHERRRILDVFDSVLAGG